MASWFRRLLWPLESSCMSSCCAARTSGLAHHPPSCLLSAIFMANPYSADWLDSANEAFNDLIDLTAEESLPPTATSDRTGNIQVTAETAHLLPEFWLPSWLRSSCDPPLAARYVQDCVHVKPSAAHLPLWQPPTHHTPKRGSTNRRGCSGRS